MLERRECTDPMVVGRIKTAINFPNFPISTQISTFDLSLPKPSSDHRGRAPLCLPSTEVPLTLEEIVVFRKVSCSNSKLDMRRRWIQLGARSWSSKAKTPERASMEAFLQFERSRKKMKSPAVLPAMTMKDLTVSLDDDDDVSPHDS